MKDCKRGDRIINVGIRTNCKYTVYNFQPDIKKFQKANEEVGTITEAFVSNI